MKTKDELECTGAKKRGVILLLGRILAAPIALFFGILALIYTMVDEGLDWWDSKTRR